MSNFFLLVLNGISYGSILFLVASGFSLIFGLLNVVSLSHGCFYLMGAYFGWMTWKATDSWLLGLIAAAAGLAVIGFLFKIVLFNRVFGNADLESWMTLGLNLVIVDVYIWLFKAESHVVNPPMALRKLVPLGPDFTYPLMRLVYIGIAVLTVIVIWFLIKKTNLGRIIRAGVDDTPMTSALGININKIFTIVFVIGVVLAGISGMLGATYMSFVVGHTEGTVLLYSMIIVVLGGMGSIQGAAVGAAIVGLIDSFTKFYIPSLSSVIMFAILIAIMCVKPGGLVKSERGIL